MAPIGERVHPQHIKPCILIAIICLTGCSDDGGDQTEQQLAAQQSLSSWQEALAEAGDGTYCLSRSYTSAFGPTWLTQAQFTGGAATEWITCEGNAQAEDSTECVQGSGADTPDRELPSMEALYEQCLNDILTADPETHEVKFETNGEGFMVACWSRPLNCADDCTSGVFIDDVNLGACDWREVDEPDKVIHYYNFVLVEDLSEDTDGEAPGANIDAISVTIDGVETFTTGIADFNLGGGSNLDPSHAAGAPDSECQAANFVALGGAGGYLVAEFGAAFKTGDSVAVYELGPTTCPNQPDWVDEPYRVSVAIHSFAFLEIGIGGPGLNIFVVP